MKKIRSERRLSLAEISKSTKIQVKYLEYIEEGEYAKLPADVYVKGFLRSYAIFMGIDEASIIKQYEREKGILKNIKKIPDEKKENGKSFIKISSLVISPKIILGIIITLFVLGSFAYLYREVNSFISEPRLVIIKPTDGYATSEKSVHVAGIAEKDALVFINDQYVLVNENGEFSEEVGLKSGLNIITVKARSRFNKETTRSVSVNASFQDLAQDQPDEIISEPAKEESQNQNKISAEVFVNPNPTWISVEVDGNLAYSGILLPQSIQNFDAQEKISITSGKGNETFVKINGKDLGVISNNPGVARDIQFNAKGKIESNK